MPVPMLFAALLVVNAVHCQEAPAVKRSHVAARSLGTPVTTANTISYVAGKGMGPGGHDMLFRATTAESGGHFMALDLVTDKMSVFPFKSLEGYPITLGSNGMVYVGSTSGEIMRYDPRTDEWGALAQVFTNTGIHHVRCIAEGKDGWLYCGSCFGERARCRMSDGKVEMLPAIPEGGNWYVSSCGTLADGRIVFGLGHVSRIFVYDPAQGKDVAQWAPEHWKVDGFAINTLVGKDVAYFSHFPSGRRGAVDVKTGEFLGDAPWPAAGKAWSYWGHSSGYGSGIDFYLDPRTDAIITCDGESVLQWNPLRPELPERVALGDFVATPELDLQLRHAILSEGEYVEYDRLRLKVLRRRTFPEPPAARGLFSLGTGPDGRLYGGAYQSMRLFRYDPDTTELKDLGNQNPTWSGEIYSFTRRRGELISCMYTGGAVTAYDPTVPWECTPQRQYNPCKLGAFGQQVYRPLGCCVGEDGRIWATGPAGWGTAGGGVAWIDPDAGTMHSTAIGDAPQNVIPIPGNMILVCGGTLRWWDAGKDQEIAQVAWPAGGGSGYALLSADPVRLLVCGGKQAAVLALPKPGEVVVEKMWSAPINCSDLRPWRDGKYVVGSPEGFATLDAATGEWHHFTDAPLGQRWAFEVIGDTVYFHSGPNLMAVDVP